MPQRAGGGDDLRIPLCVSCHDAKDRMDLDSWDKAELAAAVVSLSRDLSPEGRLLILKMVAITCDAIQLLKSAE